ncbi:hypothetical protein [Yinghuangia soli]|uniref:Uncharacterized protein n=1 Tax=Yinghuangia soli TaxID=2908204 RepID=A0AA41U182_9ACTN|nr:hypothetical protein [Yinghuangia soli]MCF2525869.1 hypothetical protein [Yinghuangia soli]
MTVAVSEDDGQYYLTGTIRGRSTARVPLGRWYKKVGAHWFGVDDAFVEPTVVRAYYDPTLDKAARAEMAKEADVEGGRVVQFVGYMQFMQLKFLGIPIPPDIYGGRLADRKPYSDASHNVIDFMGPADAYVRGFLMPFYAYNALLSDGTLTTQEQFYTAPLTNGSLYSPLDRGTGQSLVASLAAEIAPGLVTRGQVERALEGLDPVLVITPTSEEAGLEPYRIALNRLETEPLPDETTPWLAGLDESQIDAQVIGDYILLTLPDPEDFRDTVVVSALPNRTDIWVYVLSNYDTDDMAGGAGRDMLWRVREYLLEQERTPVSRPGLRPPAGRGSTGLTTAPYRLDDGPALQLRYWTMPVALRHGPDTRRMPNHVMFDGITWSAYLSFDQDSGQIALTRIQEPVRSPTFDLRSALDQYIVAVGAGSRGRIDTSNFTKAAMKREAFNTGPRLRMVNASGTDV